VIAGLGQLNVSAQTLVNRYSFTDDGTHTNIVDSVGGAAWYGILPNGGDLTDVPGQLILSASSDQYVQLPANILSNYTAVTIDCWASLGSLPANCFLYGFGNTDTGGAGEDYIFCQPTGGRIAISNTDPGYTDEHGSGGAGNLSGETVHITSVYNPVAGYEELYTNGVLVSANNGITIPMSAVNDVLNYIGRSLYTGDAYMDVELDEFRIWNGALNALQVAGCDVAGPDTVGGAADAGAVTSIQLSVPSYQLVQGGNEAPSVTAQTAGFASPVIITRLATLTSGNTNVIRINSTNNSVLAAGQGSANVIASYGGVYSTQVVTVIQPAAVLAHRYSFSDTDNGGGNVGSTVADSVGGASWDGTLPNGGGLTGSQLQLANASLQYVQLPPGIISNYNAVTIEAWATFPDTLPGACFFFAFGNQDAGGAGENYIYMQPASGHIGIGGTDPGYSGEQDAGTYGNLSLHTNLHISAVFNPQANWIAVFTNGVLAGKNTATTWQLNDVSSVLNYIGRSLYSGDSQSMDVNVDEYRIYNGALSPQGIAISDAAGPDSIPATVTNGPGALLSLSIQAPATLQPLQAGPVKLLANYANLTGWDIIGNSIFPPAGLTVSISDPTVLSYTNGLVSGIKAGTASVVTVYQGLTNTASVTVVPAAAAILAHRYSFFNEPDGSLTATDSVAGFDGTLEGSASIAGGQLVIPNTAQAAPATDYLLLPDGMLTNSVNGVGTNFNDPAVTIEAWATFAATQGYWAALFDFGYTDGGGAGAYDIHLGQLGGSTVYGISDSDNANNDYQFSSAGSVRGATSLHVVVVFNPPAGYLACYTNGVLASKLNGVTISMTGVWGTLNKIGADLWPDPGMQGSVAEFRIYNGVLSPTDVATTQLLGPTQLLTATSAGPALNAVLSGKNLVITWTATGTSAYTLESTLALGPNAAWSNVAATPTLVGEKYQVTLPATNSAQFFQLKQ